jgi:hypothetical protein
MYELDILAGKGWNGHGVYLVVQDKLGMFWGCFDYNEV